MIDVRDGSRIQQILQSQGFVKAAQQRTGSQRWTLQVGECGLEMVVAPVLWRGNREGFGTSRVIGWRVGLTARLPRLGVRMQVNHGQIASGGFIDWVFRVKGRKAVPMPPWLGPLQAWAVDAEWGGRYMAGAEVARPLQFLFSGDASQMGHRYLVFHPEDMEFGFRLRTVEEFTCAGQVAQAVAVLWDRARRHAGPAVRSEMTGFERYMRAHPVLGAAVLLFALVGAVGAIGVIAVAVVIFLAT
jgi:hypothetical protein